MDKLTEKLKTDFKAESKVGFLIIDGGCWLSDDLILCLHRQSHRFDCRDVLRFITATATPPPPPPPPHTCSQVFVLEEGSTDCTAIALASWAAASKSSSVVALTPPSTTTAFAAAAAASSSSSSHEAIRELAMQEMNTHG